jgi:putative membrane protein
MPDRSQQPYEKIATDHFILRDHLAIDRTILANERTFLAYVRTALAFLITGIGFLKFFQDWLIETLGWIFCVFSLITISIGIIRYRSFSKISRITRKRDLNSESSPEQ